MECFNYIKFYVIIDSIVKLFSLICGYNYDLLSYLKILYTSSFQNKKIKNYIPLC